MDLTGEARRRTSAAATAYCSWRTGQPVGSWCTRGAAANGLQSFGRGICARSGATKPVEPGSPLQTFSWLARIEVEAPRRSAILREEWRVRRVVPRLSACPSVIQRMSSVFGSKHGELVAHSLTVLARRHGAGRGTCHNRRDPSSSSRFVIVTHAAAAHGAPTGSAAHVLRVAAAPGRPAKSVLLRGQRTDWV
jgi:hypothetical protein